MTKIYKRYIFSLKNDYGISIINNHREKYLIGYDERYTHNNTYELNNICKVKKLIERKKILDSLLNDKVSINEKLDILYEKEYMFNFTINNNKIKPFNLFEGGLLREFDF